MIDREYGKPDFPIVSNPFDDPNSPKTFSTELENTDTFSIQDIFDLGFLRSNPAKEVYWHKDKPDLLLHEISNIDFNVKDKVVRIIVIVDSSKMISSNVTGNINVGGRILYKSTKPVIADIQQVIDSF